MVLLAAPPNASRMRCVASRALRREPAVLRSAGMSDMRHLFANVAEKRNAERSDVSSIVDRLIHSTGNVGAGASEEDLRRALDTALRSLSTLGKLYEEREARWADEMRRNDYDREKVRVLLTQVLGVPLSNPVSPSAN